MTGSRRAASPAGKPSRIGPMRFLVAALAIALMMTTAYAQGVGGYGRAGGFGGGRKQEHAKANKTAAPKTKADDKAYDAALKGLPDKQFDPWHGVR